MAFAASPLEATTHELQARPVPALHRTADPDAARKAAKEFEAFFLSQFLEDMFAGIRTDGPFGGGNGEAIYRSLLMQEYGRTLADAGGVGIADAVLREILIAQEESR